MCKKKTTEQFIQEAKEIHSDKYDYNLVDYIDNKTKVEITCQIHGSFFQKPNSHLGGQGCPDCGLESSKKTRRKTTSEFIKEAKEVHGNKYDYSLVDYKQNNQKVTIVCPVHGIFEQRAKNHLRGDGCIKCMGDKLSEFKKKTTEQFIEKAREVHGDKYDYNKAEYIGCYEKVTIMCKIHGDFKQQASNHIQGQGCPKCGKESHWRRSDYIKKANGRTCTFYILRCFNDREEFYKIGITMNTLKSRYSTIKEMPYSYEVITEVKGSADFIWDLELAEKRKLEKLNYQPTIPFDGSKTECFTQYEINETE